MDRDSVKNDVTRAVVGLFDCLTVFLNSAVVPDDTTCRRSGTAEKTRPFEFLPSAAAPRTTSDVRRPSATLPEGVGVARVAFPTLGVGGREDDAVWVVPGVVQAFPQMPATLGDVGLGGPRHAP